MLLLNCLKASVSNLKKKGGWGGSVGQHSLYIKTIYIFFSTRVALQLHPPPSSPPFLLFIKIPSTLKMKL